MENKSYEVNSYIAKEPKPIQLRLKEMRKIIMEAAPEAQEGFSYRMPYYSYKGKLAWFAAMKGYVGLYLPPPLLRITRKN